MARGRFITFEGGEGAGKSVQIARFADYLRSLGREPILTREPGGTEVGRQIRRLLVEGDKDKFDELTEMLLYYADRRIDLTQVILPALELGKDVLCDRFNDSTIAYQVYGANKPQNAEIAARLYQVVAGNVKPDITFLLDIDVKTGLERSFNKAKATGTAELRFENAAIEFHERLRVGYLEQAKKEPERFVVINASQTIEEVAAEIRRKFEERALLL